MLKRFSALLFFLFFTHLSFAQQATITGTVNSAENQPLELAPVSIKGTTTSTQTDAQGNFRLSVPPMKIWFW